MLSTYIINHRNDWQHKDTFLLLWGYKYQKLARFTTRIWPPLDPRWSFFLTLHPFISDCRRYGFALRWSWRNAWSRLYYHVFNATVPLKVRHRNAHYRWLTKNWIVFGFYRVLIMFNIIICMRARFDQINITYPLIISYVLFILKISIKNIKLYFILLYC